MRILSKAELKEDYNEKTYNIIIPNLYKNYAIVEYENFVIAITKRSKDDQDNIIIVDTNSEFWDFILIEEFEHEHFYGTEKKLNLTSKVLAFILSENWHNSMENIMKNKELFVSRDTVKNSEIGETIRNVLENTESGKDYSCVWLVRMASTLLEK